MFCFRVEVSTFMDDCCEADAERLASRYLDRTFVALIHGRSAKRIGDKHAVVPVVPPAFAEVAAVGYQHDTNRVLVQPA